MILHCQFDIEEPKFDIKIFKTDPPNPKCLLIYTPKLKLRVICVIKD